MIAFIMVYMIVVVNVIIAYASVPEGESVTNFMEDDKGDITVVSESESAVPDEVVDVSISDGSDEAAAVPEVEKVIETEEMENPLENTTSTESAESEISNETVEGAEPETTAVPMVSASVDAAEGDEPPEDSDALVELGIPEKSEASGESEISDESAIQADPDGSMEPAVSENQEIQGESAAPIDSSEQPKPVVPSAPVSSLSPSSEESIENSDESSELDEASIASDANDETEESAAVNPVEEKAVVIDVPKNDFSNITAEELSDEKMFSSGQFSTQMNNAIMTKLAVEHSTEQINQKVIDATGKELSEEEAAAIKNMLSDIAVTSNFVVYADTYSNGGKDGSIDHIDGNIAVNNLNRDVTIKTEKVTDDATNYSYIGGGSGSVTGVTYNDKQVATIVLGGDVELGQNIKNELNNGTQKLDVIDLSDVDVSDEEALKEAIQGSDLENSNIRRK